MFQASSHLRYLPRKRHTVKERVEQATRLAAGCCFNSKLRTISRFLPVLGDFVGSNFEDFLRFAWQPGEFRMQSVK
jgi:hypothetical protein